MKANRFFYDTEFCQHEEKTASGRKVVVLDLISIGIVNEMGRGYSAVLNDFNLAAAMANPFVRAHVLDKLPPQSEWKPREQVRKEILDFIGPNNAEFFYWWVPQDAFLFETLISPEFMDTPENFKSFHTNLKQSFDAMGSPPGVLPLRPKNVHEVLEDARWTRDVDRRLREHARKLHFY